MAGKHAPLTDKERTELTQLCAAAIMAMGSSPGEYSMDMNAATLSGFMRGLLDLRNLQEHRKVLLEALEAMLEAFDSGERERMYHDEEEAAACQLARAAIAKAKGGE